ncbi:MAG: hypothetical protein MUO77_14255 [Anaerolineales bacterium]|nr:hypothetical protein [Anaerolineales bacterium]
MLPLIPGFLSDLARSHSDLIVENALLRQLYRVRRYETNGKQAWDTFMTLAATTKKLNVSFYEYVRDRILKKNVIPPLSELIQKAARELMQGQPYSLACP